MRIARCVTDNDPFYGLVEDQKVIELAGDPFFHSVQPTQTVHDLDDVRLVAPIIPRSKIVGFGKNYAEHAREMGGEAPARPVMFLMPNTAVLGPGEPIRFPDFSDEISYEGELAVVIGSATTASGRAPRASMVRFRWVRGSRPNWTRTRWLSPRPWMARPSKTATLATC